MLIATLHNIDVGLLTTSYFEEEVQHKTILTHLDWYDGIDLRSGSVLFSGSILSSDSLSGLI